MSLVLILWVIARQMCSKSTYQMIFASTLAISVTNIFKSLINTVFYCVHLAKNGCCLRICLENIMFLFKNINKKITWGTEESGKKINFIICIFKLLMIR